MFLHFLKKKHPNYCEVYRVEGIFYGYLGSVREMINSFEIAIKLQPNYPNLRGYYIQHLRLATQYDKSIAMGLKCLELFPNNIEIEYQLLQTFYFSSIFNEKANSISEKNKLAAIKYKDIDLMFAKKLAKNSLEYQRRYNEYLVAKGLHEDFNLAYQNIIKLAEDFKEFEDLNLIDEITTKTTIKKSFDELYHLKRYFSGDEKEEFIDGLIEVFKNKMDIYVNSSESFEKKKFIEKFKTEPFKIYEVGDVAEGVLSRILDKKIGSRSIITGGFIEIIKGKFRDFDGELKPSIFIHSSQKVSSIPVGSKITFKFDTFDGRRKSVVAINPKIIK
jgi:tetratricopeptide (TPR) repeat protein